MRRILALGLVGLLMVGGLAFLGCNASGEGNAARAAEPGLVAQWHFDEGSGAVATDTSGYNNNGTINGSTWTNGISGKALAFDGVDDYVQVANSASLNTPNALTLEVWFKPSKIIDNKSSEQNLIDKPGSYYLILSHTNSPGKMRFAFYDQSYTMRYVTSTKSLWEANTWYHVVSTFDGSQLKIYVNGVLDNTVAFSGKVRFDSRDLVLGRYGYFVDPWVYPFNGTMDEVSIYNSSLTSDQVRSNYETFVPSPPTAPVNLIASADDSKIVLTWQAPTSDGGSTITNYKIYRGTTSGSETSLTTVGNVLTYTDTAVTNGATYYYLVSAVNSIGESARSNEASATPTTSATIPSAPSNLHATYGDGWVALTWDQPSSNGGATITSYKIWRGTSSGVKTLLATVGDALSYNDTSVSNGQTYYYTVSAVNSIGNGFHSNEATATPQAPAEPANQLWPWIVIIAVVVAVGVAAVAIIVKMKK